MVVRHKIYDSLATEAVISVLNVDNIILGKTGGKTESTTTTRQLERHQIYIVEME